MANSLSGTSGTTIQLASGSGEDMPDRNRHSASKEKNRAEKDLYFIHSKPNFDRFGNRIFSYVLIFVSKTT